MLIIIRFILVLKYYKDIVTVEFGTKLKIP